MHNHIIVIVEKKCFMNICTIEQIYDLLFVVAVLRFGIKLRAVCKEYTLPVFGIRKPKTHGTSR